MRRPFIRLFIAVIFAFYAGLETGQQIRAAEESDKPNIIFLFSDDQQANTIAAWGNPYIKTPHLDRLVDGGFSFRQTYCGGSYSPAVCVASRAMLMTGRHWPQIGNTNTWEGIDPLPAILSGNGYKSHIIGKWHNSHETLLRSFQSGKAVFIGGMCNQIKVPLSDIVKGKITRKRIEKGFSSTIFADAAVDFLSQEHDQPFFLYVAFTAPHDTRNPPMAFREMYYKNLPPVPENFLPLHPFNNELLSPFFRDENLAPWPRPKDMIQQQMAEYYGMITHLDEQVGRILDAVDKRGDRKNTYIVYTSDHGLSLGQHGLMGKQSLYEHSMKTPLIIRGPCIPKGKSSQALTYLHDIHPTILKLTGSDLTPAARTADLAPIWRGDKLSVRDTLFLGFNKNIRTIRDGRWKLLIYPQINHTQLFDLKNDPLERENLVDNPENENIISRLKNSMGDWQKHLGDHQPLRSNKPKSKEVDYSSFKQTRDRWQPDWIYDKYFRNN